ncbi:hypothetical protein KC207_04830 [Phycicoccus sp. BSK3Z-2]|uniref:Uncharacterized protein n=1 Tax=Phycicoccus avicenniae TaxID=2828860 RepID=A0A941HZ72_9MICO|nr:hypothetical protein [Phycicoccus avicenniae]MBR7742610.1 hypothetical protein [Phycicoccus avicenniae]
MAGGNLLGTWQERLRDAPAGAAMDKLSTMVSVALGASSIAKERVKDDLLSYFPRAQDLGLKTAPQVLDLIYNFDKMPNWSVTYATPNTIAPFFSPSVLAFAAHRLGNPLEYGEAHRRILRYAMPKWAEVPFYKPSAARRAIPYMWQNLDWRPVREHVAGRLEFSESFDGSAIQEALTLVERGEGTARQEILLQRFLWESTFDAYLDDVTRAAEACERDLAVASTGRTLRA